MRVLNLIIASVSFLKAQRVVLHMFFAVLGSVSHAPLGSPGKSNAGHVCLLGCLEQPSQSDDSLVDMPMRLLIFESSAMNSQTFLCGIALPSGASLQ